MTIRTCTFEHPTHKLRMCNIHHMYTHMHTTDSLVLIPALGMKEIECAQNRVGNNVIWCWLKRLKLLHLWPSSKPPMKALLPVSCYSGKQAILRVGPPLVQGKGRHVSVQPCGSSSQYATASRFLAPSLYTGICLQWNLSTVEPVYSEPCVTQAPTVLPSQSPSSSWACNSPHVEMQAK